MKRLLPLPLVAMLIAASQVSYGAGFALIEHSASGMGNAFAGGAAIADDASTIQFNPAGLTRLDQRELVAALHRIDPTAQFTDTGSTAATGGSLNGPDDEGGVLAMVPNFYYAAAPSDRYRYGIGINVPFGLTTEYDDNWVGRYHAVKSDMRTININPSAAYKLTDKLSFGLGVNLQYVEVELSSAVDFGAICVSQFSAATCSAAGIQPQQNDGFVEISGNNWSSGWNLGLLYELSADTRIGLSHRSGVEQDVTGDADFTVPSNATFLTASGLFTDGGVSAQVTLPTMTSLSVYHDYSPQLALMADATLTRWSVFEELRIKYDNSQQPDSVTTENWQDSLRLAIGANYRYSASMLLRVGVAYDPSAVPDAQHRTPRIPDANRTWLSAGIGWDLSADTRIDLGYSHLLVSDMKVDNTFESSISEANHTLKADVDAGVDIMSIQLRMAL